MQQLLRRALPRSPLLQSWFAAVFYRLGGFHALKRRNHAAGRRITVLMFHRVDDRPAGDPLSLPTLFMSREFFRKTLDFVASHYRVVDLEALLAAQAGRWQPAESSLVITFDDGYRDVFDEALPELSRRGLAGTVFLPTAFVEAPERSFWWDACHFLFETACDEPERLGRIAAAAPDARLAGAVAAIARCPTAAARRAAVVPAIHALQGVPESVRRPFVEALWQGREADRPAFAAANAVVDWEGVRRARAAGIAFGSHTRTHLFADSEAEAAFREELGSSKAELERELGETVRAFAYPGGKLHAAVPGWVQAAGYLAAFTTRRGVNRSDEPPFLLKRINMWNGTAAGVGGGFSAARLAFNLTKPA